MRQPYVSKDILAKLFPQPTATFESRGGDEVNGLPKGTVPQNCEKVLEGFSHSRITKRQDHFLVRVDGVLVYLRVCSAYEGSAYDEFAVILGAAHPGQDQQGFEQRCRERIAANC